MDRYLLDTNIVVFMITGQDDEMSRDVHNIIKDYENQLYISTVSVMELIYLYRAGRIDQKRKRFKTALDLIQSIEDFLNIIIKPFAKEHTKTLSKLEIANNHNDPFDHAIISHAITEKLILVSSDTKFKHYTPQKLNTNLISPPLKRFLKTFLRVD